MEANFCERFGPPYEVALKKYFDMYPLDKITLPKEPSGNRESKPKADLASTPEPYFGLTEPQARECKPVFTQVQRGGFPGHSVRTERWRYTDLSLSLVAFTMTTGSTDSAAPTAIELSSDFGGAFSYS